MDEKALTMPSITVANNVVSERTNLSADSIVTSSDNSEDGLGVYAQLTTSTSPRTSQPQQKPSSFASSGDKKNEKQVKINVN